MIEHPDLDRLIEKHLPKANVRPAKDIVENLKSKVCCSLCSTRLMTMSLLFSPCSMHGDMNTSNSTTLQKKFTKYCSFATFFAKIETREFAMLIESFLEICLPPPHLFKYSNETLRVVA